MVIALRPSHSADAHRQRTRLDRFGFIVNMDKQGNVVDESFLSQEEREENGEKRQERREKTEDIREMRDTHTYIHICVHIYI